MAIASSDFVRLVADLCRLRRGPQDLPHSPTLLAWLIGAVLALDVSIGGLLGDGGDALAHSLLTTGVVLGLAWLELALRGRRSRYVQTATALCACGLAISLTQLPIAALIELPAAGGADEALALGPWQALLRWLLLATLIWQVFVNANLLRHAVEIGFGFALAHATSWLVAYWVLESLLFGKAA
ncbi:hypothetical protein [Dokdonella sp.]|uniref:hypothetical protein n=1 Tax=Dokdonella sp. TaxID=2291710 RepID=UPI001AFE418F|nr:hypothetical protein [Dokdonella sp.]MBO9662193.1 hypothetical protein [Dokdonella sp.]